MSNVVDPILGSPEYYRDRAAKLFRQAEEAASEEARASFLLLASQWQALAERLAHPSW